MQHHFRDGPQLLPVAPHLVNAVWPFVEKLISNALIRSASDFTPQHIKARIDAGKSLLWIIWDTSLLGTGTTEIQKLENGRKVCVITTCAGRDHRTWEHVLFDIERYANKEGCVAVRLYGRQGWVRKLKSWGYVQPYVVVEKKLR